MLCHVKQSKKGDESTNTLREPKLTCIWVIVVVPTTNVSLAFVNRTEGALLAVPQYIFFVKINK